MKKVDKKLGKLFGNIFSSYRNLALFLLAITFALSLPLAYSLLNQETQTTSRVTAVSLGKDNASISLGNTTGVVFEDGNSPIFETADTLVSTTLRDPDGLGYKCLTTNCEERWQCESSLNRLVAYRGGLAMTAFTDPNDSTRNTVIYCPTGSYCQQIGTRGAGCYSSSATDPLQQSVQGLGKIERCVEGNLRYEIAWQPVSGVNSYYVRVYSGNTTYFASSTTGSSVVWGAGGGGILQPAPNSTYTVSVKLGLSSGSGKVTEHTFNTGSCSGGSGGTGNACASTPGYNSASMACGNYPNGDITSLSKVTSSAKTCQDLCTANSASCYAWTWVYQSQGGQCWIKNSSHEAFTDNCAPGDCVSGSNPQAGSGGGGGGGGTGGGGGSQGTACGGGTCNAGLVCLNGTSGYQCCPGGSTHYCGTTCYSGTVNSCGGTGGGGSSGSTAQNLKVSYVPDTSCTDSNYSVLLQWTNSGNGWYVDISEDSNFSGWANRALPNGATSTAAPAGFSLGLIFEPGKTYYWRVWDGQTHSATASFSRPACSGGSGGNNNGGNTQYTFTANLNKTTFAPSESGNLCYHLSPENIPYDLKLTEGPAGGTKAPVPVSVGGNTNSSGEFSDNGTGGGDCVAFNLDAQTGSFEFNIKALKDGNQIGNVDLPYTVAASSSGGQNNNNNSGNNGGNNSTQYTLTTTLDKATYTPGEAGQFCYTFTPQGTAFGGWRYEAVVGGSFTLIENWQDDGSLGSNCRPFTANSQIGQYEMKTEANVGSTKTQDIITYSVSNGTGGNNSPTATNTPVPNNNGGNNQPTATNTPVPNQGTGTLLTVGVSVPGVGSNSSAGQNANPTNQSITAEILLLDSNAAEVKQVSGTLTYNPDGYGFVGDIDLGTITDGAYTVKIRTNNSLWKAVSQQISTSGTNVVETPLITGDIDQNNVLDLIDYNAVISCYGGKSCPSSQKADLNMDGKVDEKDLNILYAGFASRQGD